jgi:thymidylate kinase
MPKRNYRVVSCEGGDQCGKGDAILTFRQKFLKEGVSVTFSSFPIYATPFGTAIRKFLNSGMETFNFDPRRDLKIKMSLYALNRLEFLDIVLSNPEYKKTLILLDRSSFSNAVTLAYGVVNIEDLSNEEIEEYIKYAFWLDNLMIRKLRLKDCVVQMVALSAKWDKDKERKQKDIYENPDVQSMTEKTYDLFQEKVGEGWKKVITKMENGWEDREDIFKNIYDFVVSRYGEFNLEVFPKDYFVNVEEVIKNSYPGAQVDKNDIKKYIEALVNNEKDPMYSYSIKIGEQIASTCEDFVIKDKDVRKKFTLILKDLPEVYEVLEVYLGESFSKLVEQSITEWTKKKKQ